MSLSMGRNLVRRKGMEAQWNFARPRKVCVPSGDEEGYRNDGEDQKY
jgi:hypothetical protein